MKQFKFYSFASALLLAGAVGLNSCSSDSVEPGGNPGVAGQVVKTQFAINIPYAKGSGNNAKASTRMTEDNTQGEGNAAKFRGIVDLRLLTFNGTPGTEGVPCTSSIYLGRGENATHKGNWRSIYSDVEIPVGTKNFVMYATASNEANATYGTTVQEPKAVGKLDKAGIEGTDISQISYSLAAINTKNDFTQINEAKNIIDALNAIVGAKITDNSTQVSWANIENATNYRQENERKALKELYTQFISLKVGSTASCQIAINRLIARLGTPSAEQTLTAEIERLCNSALTTLNSNNFPAVINLPDGIARLKFDSTTGTFSYDMSTLTMGSNNIDYTKITYPAELAYYVSSPARVSDKILSSVDGLPDYDAWTASTTTEDTWTNKGFTGTEVVNSTRTVALQNALKYGVANLKLSVKCATSTLEDNGAANNQDVTKVPVKENGFPVTAILIGGQPAKVGWDFEPTTNEAFAHTIYDTEMNKGTDFTAKYYADASAATLPYNYTLVLDNLRKGEGATQDNVYITLELTNNSGTDFVGQEGLVPNGGKFYLVGKLAKDKFTQEEGKTHAFTKDHTTIANMTISNLKNAYNCIPDLRSTQISLGLAVDIKWKTGITFDVNIGEEGEGL